MANVVQERFIFDLASVEVRADVVDRAHSAAGLKRQVEQLRWQVKDAKDELKNCVEYANHMDLKEQLKEIIAAYDLASGALIDGLGATGK